MIYIKYLFYIIINIFRFIKLKSKKNLLLISPSNKMHIENGAELIVGKGFRARRNLEVIVRKNASLFIGEKVFINSGCILICRKNIVIGEGTIFGPNVMIFDHNHKICGQNGAIHNEFDSDDVVIGKNVWIGAGAIILKGANIGDNAVIGAGSIVTGSVPSNTILIQKRETEMREIK